MNQIIVFVKGYFSFAKNNNNNNQCPAVWNSFYVWEKYSPFIKSTFTMNLQNKRLILLSLQFIEIWTVFILCFNSKFSFPMSFFYVLTFCCGWAQSWVVWKRNFVLKQISWAKLLLSNSRNLSKPMGFDGIHDQSIYDNPCYFLKDFSNNAGVW